MKLISMQLSPPSLLEITQLFPLNKSMKM